jgi:hypothetical protein
VEILLEETLSQRVSYGPGFLLLVAFLTRKHNLPFLQVDYHLDFTAFRSPETIAFKRYDCSTIDSQTSGPTGL